jgi:hypothetical protein
MGLLTPAAYAHWRGARDLERLLGHETLRVAILEKALKPSGTTN